MDYYHHQISLADFENSFKDPDSHQMLKDYQILGQVAMPEFKDVYIDDASKFDALLSRNYEAPDISIFSSNHGNNVLHNRQSTASGTTVSNSLI